MNYYNEIKNKLIDNEIYAKVKDYSKERNKVLTYFEIGRLLCQAGNKYGKNIIVQYGQDLSKEINKKYNYRTLYRMRKFYEIFSNQKLTTLLSKLSWSHYLLLLSIKNHEEIIYYIKISVNLNLTQRQLQDRIKKDEYNRLSIETRNKLIKEEKIELKDLVPNPIVIKNSNNYEIISEKIIQKLILDDLPSFLEELGTGFTFVRNEYKIKLGDNYNYIDLLLYNIEYNCYVVIELKVTELKKEHIGQIQVYMNYIDENLKKINQDKTIGIIICKKDNKYVIKYCSDKRIVAREYEVI